MYTYNTTTYQSVVREECVCGSVFYMTGTDENNLRLATNDFRLDHSECRTVNDS